MGCSKVVCKLSLKMCLYNVYVLNLSSQCIYHLYLSPQRAEVDSTSWSLGHSVEKLVVETSDPWSEQPGPLIPARHTGKQFVFVFIFVFEFVFVYVLLYKFYICIWTYVCIVICICAAPHPSKTQWQTILWKTDFIVKCISITSNKPFRLIINSKQNIKPRSWQFQLWDGIFRADKYHK